MIHKTAIISDKAQIGKNVTIGPYSIIDDNVEIGDGTIIGNHVHIERLSVIGENNFIGDGALIGSIPQDEKYNEEPTYVQIGNDNKIREYVTIHRATKMEKPTTVGNGNFIMAGAHLAHDVTVQNKTIIVSNCMIAGHVIIEDSAVLGGASVFHQGIRIGSFAMVGGMSGVGKDVMPYVMATPYRNESGIHGLNSIGLKRNGFKPDKIKILKRVYEIFFREKLVLKEAVDKIQNEVEQIDEVKHFVEFSQNAKKGIYR